MEKYEFRIPDLKTSETILVKPNWQEKVDDYWIKSLEKKLLIETFPGGVKQVVLKKYEFENQVMSMSSSLFEYFRVSE